MNRVLAAMAALLVGVLLCMPGTSKAGGYGYGYGYYPTYYSSYATIPTYSYYTPTYYTPTYYYPTYTTPTYTTPTVTYNNTNATTTTATASAAAPKDWKNQLLELAKARDQVEGQIRLNNAEYNAFAAATKALGLEGNFHMEGYGQVPPAPGQGGFQPPPGVGYGGKGYVNHNANLGTYGANGSTVYSYTVNSVKDLYGDTNMNTLFQQAAQLAQNSQALAGEATQQFQSSISKEGTNRARVAEILAKAQAASAALQAAEGRGVHSETQTTVTKVENGQQQAQQTQQVGGDSPQQSRTAVAPQSQADPAFIKLASNRCLSCHGPDKQEGGFDVRKYSAMGSPDKEKVWRRLLTTDEKRLMPKGGPPLTAEEKRLFFSN